MTPARLTRPQRAMQIERRTSRTWMVGAVGIVIPSRSRKGVFHTVTLDDCSCEDFRFAVRPGVVGRPQACQHMIAARLMFARQRAG